MVSWYGVVPPSSSTASTDIANVVDPQTRTAGERGRPEPVLPRLPMPSNRLNGCRACERVRCFVCCVLVRFARARACLLLGRAGGARHPFRHHVIGLVRSNFRTRCRVVVCAYAPVRTRARAGAPLPSRDTLGTLGRWFAVTRSAFITREARGRQWFGTARNR